MTLSKLAFWKSEGKKAKVNNGGGGAKKFFSQLSGAFMLPISVMALAGLMLGVGSAIASNATAEGLQTFGKFIQNFGDPVFGAMPILFTMAMIIAFTDDIGTAVFAGIVGFLVFNALQSPFIETKGDDAAYSAYMAAIEKANGNKFNDATAIKELNPGMLTTITASLAGKTFANHAALKTALDGIKFTSDTGIAHYLMMDLGGDFAVKGYKAAGTVAGIKALNTSIFAGIIYGYIAARMYNKFHTVTFPSMISFFGGKRCVSFINILVAAPLAIVFLLLWPFIAVGLGYFGEYSGKVAGLDSFIFGWAERSLVPFGLHHVFYSPLWYTGAGGEVVPHFLANSGNLFTGVNGHELTSATFDANTGQLLAEGAKVTFNKVTYDPNILSATNAKVTNPTEAADALKNAQESLRNALIADLTSGAKPAVGDSFGWLAVNGSHINTLTWVHGGTFDAAKGFYVDAKGDKVMPDSAPIFEFLSDKGLKLGRFMQGKFAFMQFALPAAGAAMVMAAPKENRKTALGTVFPACLTSFVTGVTEPIEFTFLFLAPWLFWGFHGMMAAFSFLFMNLMGAHMGMTFSGGFLDTIVYGAIPFQKGTNFYWYFVIGAGYAPIYYFFFLFAIKKFNLDTPGRGGNVKLFTKADFKAKQGGAADAKGALTAQSAAIIEAYGGWDNITSFKNCATRLRYDVKDASKVSTDALKAAGAAGVMRVSNVHVQAIMGPTAEQINTNITMNKNAPLGNEAAKPAAKEEAKHESIIQKVEHAVVAAEKAVVKKVTKKPAAKSAAKAKTKK